jgi:hypothetical protein
MRRQRGAALILFATVLILGVAWFAVGALGKAAVAIPERETKTGLVLREAKQALLAYVAQHAARSTTTNPGQMPCPESLTLANPGEASSACSASAIVVGRLPWKTLGIDPLDDGYGEPLWYMLRGFRNPPINFGTAGQLAHDGSPVVAMIIAPGPPRNTASVAGTPTAGCTKQNQIVANRNAANLNAANFLECGVAGGSITTPANDTWTNDRVITITADEWADAIAPAIADRLQREVAPAMEDFRSTTSLASWGERYFPNASRVDIFTASTFPESNNLCGNVDVRSGMPPTATRASGACSTDWNGGSLFGLGLLLSFGSCWTTAADLRCSFTMLLPGVATPGFQLNAPNVGYTFRAFDPADIRIQVNGGASQNVTVTSYSGAGVNNADGSSAITFQLQFPLLAVAANVVVVIPWASDALLADARSAWYVNNGWDRFTYYGISQAASHDPGFAVCNPGGTVTNCMTVNNMAAPTNDKRLVLALTGRRLSNQSWPSPAYNAFTNPNPLTHYWERQNASVGVIYEVGDMAPNDPADAFNDRVAACPFKYTNAGGVDVIVCS